MEQSVQVQILFSAQNALRMSYVKGLVIGSIAQLVRAFGLHPKGPRFESLWIHKIWYTRKIAGQDSQVGHGGRLKNVRYRFDSCSCHS